MGKGLGIGGGGEWGRGGDSDVGRHKCPLIFPSQTQVATKRQQVISQFAHLSRVLEEQQSVLLAQLERLDGDILKQQEEFDSLATGEICRFSTLIEELEEKNKRPARGLLTVRWGPALPPGVSGSRPDWYLLYIFVSASQTGCVTWPGAELQSTLP